MDSNNRSIQDQATVTATSNRESCHNAFKLFVNNYEYIKDYNTINLDFIHKAYYNDIIEYLQSYCVFATINKELPRKYFTRFRVYPMIEYLALYVYDKVPQKTPLDKIKKKTTEADFSIFIKFMMQLTLIYQNNIKTLKKEKRGEFSSNANDKKKEKQSTIIQISPIFNDAYKESSFEDLKKNSQKTNFFAIELENIPEILCFVIPNVTFSFPNISSTKKEDSFEEIDKKFKGLNNKLQNEEVTIEELRGLIKENIPKKFRELIEKLTRKTGEEDHQEEITLDSIFLKKVYDLGDISWEVDWYFWLEYYWLIQIQRMVFAFSQEVVCLYNDIYKEKSEKYNLRKNKNFKKKKENLIHKVSKDQKDSIRRFFRRTNYIYINFIEWIGEEGFIDSLILFEDENIRKFIDPKSLKKNISPLELFYIFMTKITVL